MTAVGKFAEVSLPGLRRAEAIGPRPGPGIAQSRERLARLCGMRASRETLEVGFVGRDRIVAPGPVPSGLLAAARRRDHGGENPRHDYNSAHAADDRRTPRGCGTLSGEHAPRARVGLAARHRPR